MTPTVLSIFTSTIYGHTNGWWKRPDWIRADQAISYNSLTENVICVSDGQFHHLQSLLWSPSSPLDSDGPGFCFDFAFLAFSCCSDGFGQGCRACDISANVQHSSFNACSSNVNWPCFVRDSSLMWAQDDRPAGVKLRLYSECQVNNIYKHLRGILKIYISLEFYLWPDHQPDFWHKTHLHTPHL